MIRWHVGPLPTTLLEVAILATLLIFAVETVQNRAQVQWRGPLLIPASVFILAGAISVLVSGDHRAALGLYRAYFLEPAAYALVVGNVAWTVRRVGVVLLGFAAGGVYAALLNMAVVIDAIRHHVLDLATTPPVVIYQTANALALYLIPLVAIAASVCLYGRSRWDRWAGGIFLVVAVPASILTFSRGGFLALAVIGLGLAISHRRAKLLLPAVVLLGLLISQIPPIRRRIAYELHPIPGNTLDFRLRLWGQTLKLMSHHPVFGIGLSYYQQAMGPYWQDLPQVIYPHNIFLNFWTITGIPGLIGFVWLSVRTFILSLRGWWHDEPAWRPYELGILLALLAILAHGLVDVPFFKNDLSLEYWALVGVAWAASQWGGRTSP
ncbi:MAG TPA: O-antigen ligase family protein [Candidatus Dormibacteraeota bacterium]